MKNVYKNLLLVMSAAGLLAAAAPSSWAVNNKNVFPKQKVKIQHKKAPRSAHRIVNAPVKKKDDSFSHLNR